MEVFMSRQRVYLLGLGLMLALGAATVLCQADEPKKDVEKELTAEEKDKALEEVALAYRIADAGRKAGSPEALLGAAKLLSKLNGKEIGLVKLEGVKPVTGKGDDKKKIKPGEPIKEDGGKPTSFAAEIQKLKADARKLNNPRDDKLTELIDAVDEKGRGSLGGPKWMGPYTLDVPDDCTPGQTGSFMSFEFKFRGGEPARVLVRNKSGAQLGLWCGQFDEGNPGLFVNATSKEVKGTSDLELKWRPQKTTTWAVTVSNSSDVKAEFDLFKN
jgi:hypothetical protein